MLKKLNNESVAILSAVASGLVVEALYPSVSELLKILGQLFKNKDNHNSIDLLIALLNILIIFILFLLLWKFCTFFLPSFIRFYEKRKKIRYVPKSSSEQVTLFYKVFVETMEVEKESLSSYDNMFKFYIMLNRTLELCHRLILATSHHKNDIVINHGIFRTENRNQNFLNYRKYINSYDYVATIDVLLSVLKKAAEACKQLSLNTSLVLNDIQDATNNLTKLKKQVLEEK